MRRIVEFIDRLEEHLLRWLRLAAVVIVALIIVGAVLTFLVSLMNLAASTDVSVGRVDRVVFSVPNIRNIERLPKEVPRDEPENRTADLGDVDGLYQSEIDKIVITLHPLMDAVEFTASASNIRGYVRRNIEKVAEIVEEAMGFSGSEATRRVDKAVGEMVAYVDDLVDYYADEIDLEISNQDGTIATKVQPEFKRHLHEVFKEPLSGYLEGFREAAVAAVADAERKKEEGLESVMAGRVGMASLPIICAVVIALLFLLLLFKIEIRLARYEPSRIRDPEADPEVAGE